jgi:phosphoserine phosphatase RsbU/P
MSQGNTPKAPSTIAGATPQPIALLVDDDPLNLRVLEAMLRSAGFRTLSALSGPEGRAATEKHAPDIILLDVMMPEESGFETCRLLKANPATADIPIIFISALHDVEDKIAGLEAGAVDFITKPFEKAEVLARVRLHLKLVFAHKKVVEEQAVKLRQVADAQQSMLADPADLPEACFAVQYLPILEAGGDFYDVFLATPDTFYYFVADISGHDLGASMATSSLKALIRQNSGPLFTPEETLKNVNDVLGHVLTDGRYLTAQLCRISRRVSEITLITAGHPPAVFVPMGHPAEFIRAQGDVLGAFNKVSISPVKRRVARGDRLFMYTDGLTEGAVKGNKTTQEVEQQLLALCGRTMDMPLSEAVKAVTQGLLPEENAQQDDVLLLGIEI